MTSFFLCIFSTVGKQKLAHDPWNCRMFILRKDIFVRGMWKLFIKRILWLRIIWLRMLIVSGLSTSADIFECVITDFATLNFLGIYLFDSISFVIYLSFFVIFYQLLVLLYWYFKWEYCFSKSIFSVVIVGGF